jgi:hypothetical protein
MSQKRKGQLTVSGEWAKHLRPFLRRMFWKGERQAEKGLVRTEEIAAEKLRARTGKVEDSPAPVQGISTDSK